MTADLHSAAAAVAYLRSPATIRSRARSLLELARAGKSKHFKCAEEKLGEAVATVVQVIRRDYPTLQIPYHSRWRHFDGSRSARPKKLAHMLAECSCTERGRAAFDLAIISVLLDAGAGMSWRYRDCDGVEYARSEGLAMASFDAFAAGAFSSSAQDPLRVDAEKLRGLTAAQLAAIFQVSDQNPLLGLEGRLALLRKLGATVSASPDFFNAKWARPGDLFEYLMARARDGFLPAAEVLAGVLSAFSTIWPGRIEIGAVNLGDVWKHSALRTDDLTSEMMPFHKLSQWLTYSLLEPLQDAGLRIGGLGELTGLAEYRNGGLFADSGTVVARDPQAAAERHSVSSEFIVEWRALTVALLDETAELVRKQLGKSEEDLPLASVLQGGTWSAGRELAARLRKDGGPPFIIESDGTVF